MCHVGVGLQDALELNRRAAELEQKKRAGQATRQELEELARVEQDLKTIIQENKNL